MDPMLTITSVRCRGKADIHTFTDLTFNDLETAYAGVVAEALEKFRAPEGNLTTAQVMSGNFEHHVNGEWRLGKVASTGSSLIWCSWCLTISETVFDFSEKFHQWITDVSVNIANGVGIAYKINTHPAMTVCVRLLW